MFRSPSVDTADYLLYVAKGVSGFKNQGCSRHDVQGFDKINRQNPRSNLDKPAFLGYLLAMSGFFFSHLAFVALGGALGASLRYFSGLMALRLLGAAFPYGTLFVNIVGSLAMGLVIAWFSSRTHWTEEIRLFLTTGLLGGFTTFSAFSLDFANLWQRGEIGLALVYVAASVLFSIIAVFAGLALGRAAL